MSLLSDITQVPLELEIAKLRASVSEVTDAFETLRASQERDINEVAKLRRELALERARLDWWAQKSLDRCTMDSMGEVADLDQNNIRASIDSHRRREAAHERRRPASPAPTSRGPLGLD
jgi:multidrug resistance efflux pump